MWPIRTQSLWLLCGFVSSGFKQERVCLASASDSNHRRVDVVSDLVGHTNECQITIDDTVCQALLDTGANVSTICQGSVSHLFPDGVVMPLNDFSLDIECAGDNKLPHSGYVEVEVAIPGVVSPLSCLLLVTPDTRYGHNVPVILGTNILKPMMDVVEEKHGVRYQQILTMPDALYFSFRCLKLQSRHHKRANGQLGIVKCAMVKKIIIPENTTMVVDGCLDNNSFAKGQFGITQPLKKSVLPYGVSVTPTLVDGKCGIIPIEISNLTTSPIVLTSNSILCQVQSCELDANFVSLSDSDKMTLADPDCLLVDLSKSNIANDELSQARNLLINFDEIFSRDDMDVGLSSLVKHNIHLTNNIPFKQRYRRIPPSMFVEVQRHIQELLDAEIIRPSQSPWASNIVLVRKHDASLRLCVDFRQLNLRTVKDAYALPRIDELLESLGGNKFYSVLDMRKGYHQVEILEDHKPLMAFTLGPLGFYEYNRLPLGLSNAPATYQRLMEQIFGVTSSTSQFCKIYLDDIIVYSDSFQEHMDHLTQVFGKVKKSGMKLSPGKCHLFREKVKYVGHIVSGAGIEADPDKVEQVRNWPVPTQSDEVRTFLGFTGYYRRFVQDYAKIAKPLNDLLQGNCAKRKAHRRKVSDNNSVQTGSFVWADAQQLAFDKLKELLTTPPVLIYPDYKKPFVLHTDASMNGLGAILYQEHEGKERVIAFASRGLSKAERNYPVHKLEFLALKWAVIKKFSDYLYGNSFVVFTDNNPLTYVLQKAKLDATCHRWIAALSAYDFVIRYRCGKSNSDADGLSRMPFDNSTVEDDFRAIPHEVIKALCQTSL